MSDEKADEKQDEKTAEKSWDEKWRRDPVSAVVWAGILIWAGVVFLLDNLGILDQIRIGADDGLDAWPVILFGVGGILILEVLVRLTIPEYRQPVTGTLILAVIFIGIGLGGILDVSILLPLILIAIGLVVLFRGILR